MSGCEPAAVDFRPPARLVLCTSGGLFGTLVLRRLLATERVQVAGIVLSTRILSPRYGWLRGAFEQARRSGPAYAIYLWCATSLADLCLGWSTAGSVASLAQRWGIPLLQTRDLNQPDGLAFLAARQADLLVSTFFNQKIGATARSLSVAGAVNLHPSPLPEFRGVDPVFFARLRDAAELGVSLHRLDDGFDTGGILAQAALPPATGESVFRTTARLFDLGARLLLERLDGIGPDSAGKPQGQGGGYDSWPTPRDVRALGRRGTRLVAARDLSDLVRGWPP